MSSIINNYPVFEDNQVLTASQLNRLSDYLDQQTRLTRSRLIGMGIGCGLESNFDNTTGNVSVTISKGIGVTSEGFLVDMPECILTKYRVYENPPYVPFDNVLGQDRDPNDPRMWELLPADATPQANDVELNDDPQFLNDKAIVLFLECLDLDNRACLGNACDEIGQSRTFTLRKLVIFQQDLQTMLQILQQTDGCLAADGGLFAQKFDANRLRLGRPFFDTTVNDYFEFANAYQQLLEEPVIGDLFDELAQSYVAFEPILEPLYGENPFTTSLSVVEDAIKQYVTPAGNDIGFNYFGIQYMYDALKDIIKALREFREVSYNLISQCCTNSNCFPKHLVLGEATATGDNCLQSSIRTRWVSSAMTNNQQALLRDVTTLHKRLVLMVEKLNITAINNPVNLLTKITPSCEKKELLARREIPFYYDINTEGIYDIGTLEQNWDPADSRQCLNGTDIVKLSYFRNQMSTVRSSFTRSTNIDTAVANPLQFDLDPFNFFRMGAVHNKSYDGTDGLSAELENYSNTFNLPYKVMNLTLVEDDVEGLKNLCNFADLNAQFLDYREDLKRHTLMSAYKTQPGDIFVTSGKGIFQDRDGNDVSPINGQSIIIDTDYDADFGINGAAHGLPVSISATYGRDFASQFIFSTELGETGLHTLMIDYKDACVLLYNKLLVEFKEFDFGINPDDSLASGEFMQLYVDAMDKAMLLKAGLDEKISRLSEDANNGSLSQPLGYMINIFAEMQRSIDNFVSSSLVQQWVGLYALYQYQLTYLATNDPRVFSNFIAKNPGINHGAGVNPGGTFILLRSGTQVDRPSGSNSPVQTVAADTVIGDFYIPGSCCDDNACIDIPAPSTGDLHLPLIPVPVYEKYNPNTVDLISADASITITCAEIGELNVDALLTYDRARYGAEDVILQVLDASGAVIVDGLDFRKSATGFPAQPSFVPIDDASGSLAGFVTINEKLTTVGTEVVPTNQVFAVSAAVCPASNDGKVPTLTYTFDYKFLIVEGETVIQTSNISTVSVTIANIFKDPPTQEAMQAPDAAR